MTSINLTANEGEVGLNEEEEIREWCNENKKYNASKMHKRKVGLQIFYVSALCEKVKPHINIH